MRLRLVLTAWSRNARYMFKSLRRRLERIRQGVVRSACAGTSDVRLLRLRPDGMFSNVNEVVEQLRRAEAANYRFIIEWTTSCYRDPERHADPWTYYFEACFPEQYRVGLPILAGGVEIACCRDNIITPRIRDGDCNPLLLPQDRQRANDLISRYIRLKPDVAESIQAFASKQFRPRMIGLHIRGPGRTDGGVPALRRRYGNPDEVPLKVFFEQTDEALRQVPDAGIFGCSDSSVVIDAIRDRYGDRAAFYPAIRSPFGEMHTGHPRNEGQVFPPYRLGLDILNEAYLLARTDMFVHGNSNVANFVLCATPLLPHAYVMG